MTLPNTNRLDELQKQLLNIFEEFSDPFKPKGWYYTMFMRWQIFDLMGDIEIEKARIMEEKYRKQPPPKDQVLKR